MNPARRMTPEQDEPNDTSVVITEPATTGHLRRYLLGLATIGLAAWAVANLLGIGGRTSP